MAWYNSVTHAVGNVVGPALIGAGTTYDYLTPGTGSSKATNTGRAITNPNVTWSSPSASLPGGSGSGFTYGPTAASGRVQGATTQRSAQNDGSGTPLTQQNGLYTNTTNDTVNRQAQIDFINRGYDTKLTGLQGQLDTLTPAQQAAELRTQNQYQNQFNSLQTQHAQGQRNLNYSRNQVNEQQQRGLKGLRDQLAQQSMGYSNQLGAYGAGDSSAANMVNFALAGQASRNRGDVMQGSADQLSEIGMQEQDLNMAFEQNRKTLDDWKQSTLAELAQTFAQQKFQIQQEMANADLSRQQQLAQYDAAMTQSALDRLSQIQDMYTQQSADLINRYQNIFAPQNVQIAPNLQQYEVKPIDPGQIQNMQMPTAVNPESELAVAMRRRDEDLLQNPLMA